MKYPNTQIPKDPSTREVSWTEFSARRMELEIDERAARCGSAPRALRFAPREEIDFSGLKSEAARLMARARERGWVTAVESPPVKILVLANRREYQAERRQKLLALGLTSTGKPRQRAWTRGGSVDRTDYQRRYREAHKAPAAS